MTLTIEPAATVIGFSKKYVACQDGSQSGMWIRSWVLPLGYATTIRMSRPSPCMWGETASTSTSVGMYQLALISTSALPAGSSNFELDAVFQWSTCLMGTREK